MWDINGILARLEIQKDRIPEETYKQIANSAYYYPPCEDSFHDAWLIDFHIQYGVLENLLKGLFDRYDIAMKLLGPYHDRIHTIRYVDVQTHTVSAGAAMGDLLEHAFQIEDDGRIIHDVIFVGGTMRILSKDVRIETERFAAP